MFGGGWNPYMNLYKFSIKIWWKWKKNKIWKLRWLQEMEMQLKLTFQPKRQCVGWEVWYVHLASKMSEIWGCLWHLNFLLFIFPFLLLSILVSGTFSIWPERHLFMTPSTPCLSSGILEERAIFSIPNIKISWKGSGGTCARVTCFQG